MKRLTVLLTSAALAAGCAHSAYGPSGDARLEAAVAEGSSQEGADVAALKCDEIQQRLRTAIADDREAERLQALSQLLTESKERSTKLDEAAARNPDLLFGATGDAIKANLEDCRAALADTRSALDRTVREITETPIIQEVKGSKTVNVARLDFGVVRNAIAVLDPDDKDVLVGRLDAAEKKLNGKK